MSTTSGSDDPPHEQLHSVPSEPRQLVNIAYRLLGSLTEAEDVVQETYARWYALSSSQQQAIDRPAAWLNTVATRICLDILGSARARRERYVGEWIPEPLPDRSEWIGGSAGTEPADQVTLDDSISMAFLVVLESMTPAERVAFILHDVFSYPFTEISDIVGRTPAACRQLASSARRRLDSARRRPTPTARHAQIVRDFKQAWAAKDIGALIDLLDTDATATGDGGGLANAAPRPIEGAGPVASFFVEIADRAHAMTLHECTVNGQPGLAAQRDNAIAMAMAFDIVDDKIKHIWAVLNPDKLRHWTTDATQAPRRQTEARRVTQSRPARDPPQQ